MSESTKVFSSLQVGVDYYPEQWDETLWEQDAALMQQTGVKIIRVAEFAWSRLEPRDGQFDFAWLDRAIDIFHRHDMQVVIGTPTNTPPRWLTSMHSDILPIKDNGDLVHPGVRGHRCFNSPSLLQYSTRIVKELAKHYSMHPAVCGWQIDNEYWLLECHCESCSQRFQEWVKAKYSTLEALNLAWGTVVWSGEYSEWSQITTPLGGTSFQNPSFLLDYHRFQSESAQTFQHEQIEVIRQYAPGHFITHNFHSYPQKMDIHLIGAELDFASFDYYPNTSPDKTTTGPYSGALSLDLTRGIKRRNFWIMEQLSGPPGCWFPNWRTPYPGFIRAFSWQTIARGADTVVHFRWRSALQGAEQFWHGLIDHSNVPGRRFDEFARLCEEVNHVAVQLEGTSLRNDIAILYSSDQLVALRNQQPVEGFDYYENMKAWHKALTKLGLGVDVIHTDEDLDGYKMILAPHLYLIDDKLAGRIEQFAASGGTVILTERSGVKDTLSVCHMLPLPALLSKCAGVTVTEYDPIGNDIHTIRNSRQEQFTCTQWNDLLEPVTAEAIAWYADDFYEGVPAVTRNSFGEGTVYYVGTQPDDAYMEELIKEAAGAANIPFYIGLPEGIQLSIRQDDTKAYLFVLNLSRQEASVDLGQSYFSLLSRSEQSSHLTLPPYGVEILDISSFYKAKN
ncbi:beta-galactosidase [Neobacillus mesonae]|nr:beta-galactosidase [Neobacillus mesonae]